MSRRKYINQADVAYPGCSECVVHFMAFKCACETHTPPCFRFDRKKNIHHQLEKALRDLPKVNVA